MPYPMSSSRRTSKRPTRVGSAGDIEGLTDSWEPRSADNAWSAARSAKLAYARLHFVSACELKFEMIDAAQGGALDTFTITKC